MSEIENLKWQEVTSLGNDKEQGSRWDSRCPNHAIDAYSYWLVDHLEAPGMPKPSKPWDGKIKGTYIRPSVKEEDENDWT